MKRDEELLTGFILTDRFSLSDKDLAALYNVLASIEFSMKNYIQAAKYQEKTIELNASEPAYYYNISRLYKELDKNEELMESLNYLVTIFKNKDPKKEKINLAYLDYARKIWFRKIKVTKSTRSMI